MLGVQYEVKLRGKQPLERTTPFAMWLFKARERRGFTMVQLAEAADLTSHARISQLERGGNPSPDMVRRLAAALAPPNADERTVSALTDEGLIAAGFAPEGSSYAVVAVSDRPADTLTDEDRERLYLMRKYPQLVGDVMEALRKIDARVPTDEEIEAAYPGASTRGVDSDRQEG